MEDLNLIDDTQMEGGLNDQIKDYVMETAKWAKFIAIVMIVFSAIIALSGIFAGSVLANIARMGGGGTAMAILGSGFFTVMYLGMAIVMFIPNFFLLKFANNAKDALNSGNESTLTEAFEKLKSYFKFHGILMAILLGFYALLFVIGIFGGMMSSL